MILLFFLLPQYGMEGYFLSFVITHLINFILSLRRLLKISIRRIPFFIPAISVGSAIFAAQAAVLIPTAAFRCFGFLLILGCLLFLFRVLTREDVRWISSLVRRKSPS